MGHKGTKTGQTVGHGTNTSVPVPSVPLAELDRIAFTMEKLWGENVLPLLVGKELRDRFKKQKTILDQAIESEDKERISNSAAAMSRAWKKLDIEARSQGNKPTGAVWCGWHPNGTPVCVYTAGVTINNLPEKILRFHIDELVAMIPPEVINIKAQWPDATVKEVRDKEKYPFDDPIPF